LEGSCGYIIRITKNEVLNRIYGERIYYIELRRDWSKGSKLVFMKRTSHTDYSFIGSGIIDETFNADRLNYPEKLICIKNNCYKKIVFGQLVKFYPAVTVKDSLKDTWKTPALLHGAKVTESEILRIENLVTAFIVS
jgi:hypothetical protein